MIRMLENTDIEKVVDIWLDVNQKAHDFIPAQYWKNNYELVKEILPQAEVYVYEDGQEIQGFVGVSGYLLQEKDFMIKSTKNVVFCKKICLLFLE